ncbi:MAG TPA: hypothetical protein VJT83_09885 [Chitinophagaceae bacterium]|nr:hypothetical protein [Chitinophagaceae bacterium]
MKSNLRSIAFVVIVVTTFTACQKELKIKADEIVLSANTPLDSCFYTGIGYAAKQNDGSTIWKNILLRWEDNSRRVKNIKIKLPPYQGFSNLNVINLDYGEVIYNTGQMRLIDVSNNHELLRATMNVYNTRPLVSWYDGHLNIDYPVYDTSYYTYDGMNRIQSIRQHQRFHGFSSGSVTTWNFEYDPAGNLVTIKPGLYGGYEFRYDYTQLDSGMATLHYLSPATKTLEYLGLLPFEHHHKLTGINKYETSGYPVNGWFYQYTEKNSRGNVISYGTDQNKWYTSWSCYGENPVSNKNPTREEFMRMVH